MARKTQPMSLKALSGNVQKLSKAEIAARKREENKLKLSKNKLKAPKWLGEIAAAEFKFIVKQTEEIELLNNLDIHVLAIYCDTYERYIECSRIIEKDGLITNIGHFKTTKKLIKISPKKEMNEIVKEESLGYHPLLIRQKDLFAQLRSLQSELGLTPSARAKIAMDKANENAPKSRTEERFGNV